MIKANNLISIDFDATDLTKDELIERVGRRTARCEKHNQEYEAQAICKWGKNQVIMTNCPICDKERETREKQEELRDKQKKELAIKKNRENALLQRGVSKRYLETSFSETPLIIQHGGLLNFSQGGIKTNLIIFGRCGAGKSFFAYRMVELAHQAGLEYQCVKAKVLRDIYKQAKDEKGSFRFNSEENIAFIKHLDCLIIDELDDIFDNMECFKHAVSIAYDNCVRLVLIGNFDLKDFRDKLEAKTYSRLAGAKTIAVNYEDLRMKNKDVK